MPNLAALVERHKKNGKDAFALVGLNTGDSEADYHEGVKEFGVSWDCAFQGQEKTPISDLYQVQGYPTIYVLDGEGRIRFKDVRGKRLDEVVQELIDEMGKGESEGAGE